MNFLKLRKIYLIDTYEKFQKQYKIDLKSWQNPYKKIKYIYINEIAAIFSFIFFKLNIKPNYITLLNILSAIIILLIFSLDLRNYFYFALFLIFSKNILDNVDGFIARIKKQTSNFGERLDFYSAKIYYFSILICFLLHIINFKNNLFIWIFFISIVVLDFINPGKLFSNFRKKKKINQLKKNILLKFFVFFNYDGRTNIVDLIVLTIFLELLFQKIIFSITLCFFFVFIKIARNLFYFLNYESKR